MRKAPLFGFSSFTELHRHLLRKGLDISINTVRKWEDGTMPNGNSLKEIVSALALTKEEVYYWINL